MPERWTAGAPGARTQWAGPAGLAEFQRRARCAVRDPAGFRVRLREVDVGGVRIAEWRCSELSAELPPRDEVVLVHVLGGTVRGAGRRGRWDAGAGQLVLLPVQDPIRIALPSGAHTRSLRVPVGLVPPHLRERCAGGVVASSAMADAFLVSLGAVADATLGHPVPSDFIGQSLRSLAFAVLDEQRLRVDGTSDELRQRIERFVDGRLGDSRLTPGSIASAFDVSLRWVHQAFNRDGETIARYIRMRRADAVADEVRRGGWTAGTGALAAAYGFSGRDHLGRVFRARYGMTVAEFQAAARAGAAPEPRTVRAGAGG